MRWGFLQHRNFTCGPSISKRLESKQWTFAFGRIAVRIMLLGPRCSVAGCMTLEIFRVCIDIDGFIKNIAGQSSTCPFARRWAPGSGRIFHETCHIEVSATHLNNSPCLHAAPRVRSWDNVKSTLLWPSVVLRLFFIQQYAYETRDLGFEVGRWHLGRSVDDINSPACRYSIKISG